MFAKSLCHALLFLVAVTLVSGQYRMQTFFEDSTCNTPNGGVFYSNVGAGCTIDPSCAAMAPGLYKAEQCIDALPVLPTDVASIYSYQTVDNTCSDANIDTILQVPVAVCTAYNSIAVKVSGCNPTTVAFIYTWYSTVADCLANTGGKSAPIDSGLCIGMTDTKYVCPVPAPIAPPVDPPVNPPMNAPVSPPMDAPMAAPVAAPTTAPVAAPKAATPVKKASDATYNVMIGSASIIAMLPVVA